MNDVTNVIKITLEQLWNLLHLIETKNYQAVVKI